MTRPILCSLMALALVLTNLWFAQSDAQIYGQAQQYQGYGNGYQQNAPDNILIILDASDSMNEDLADGQTKFEAAKRTVFETIRRLPPNVNVGLRVYGHRLSSKGNGRGGFFGPLFMSGGDICRQTQLLVPLGPNNGPIIASKLLEVEAMGRTPITYALQQSVTQDFINQPGKKKIILISDGRETCSVNPCTAAVDMVRSGVNVQINTIGFATHDRVADDQLKCVALSTKGRFYSTDTAAQLARSLQDSTQIQTNVQAKIFTGQ